MKYGMFVSHFYWIGASVLIGFSSEDDWFEYRLEHHPDFLDRIARARDAIRRGKGVRLEDVR